MCRWVMRVGRGKSETAETHNRLEEIHPRLGISIPAVFELVEMHNNLTSKKIKWSKIMIRIRILRASSHTLALYCFQNASTQTCASSVSILMVCYHVDYNSQTEEVNWSAKS